MNELQASLSPTSLPCNSETDPADVQYSSLQLTVANVSGSTVLMPASELRIELVADPADTTGTAGALILAQYAPTVSVAPGAGTNWSVTQAQDAPCAFLLNPDSGQMNAGEQATFNITGIAVDLMQGVSPVTATVVPPGGPTVANTPAVIKTAPLLTITSFTAQPQHLIPPVNQTVLTWSTIGAGTCQLGWDQPSAQVSYDGSPLQNNCQVPLQATGAPDSPSVTAELFDNTQFTLSAVGPVTFTQECVIVVDQATFRANSGLVSPYEYFALTWSCLNDTGPSLSWQSQEPNAIVSIVSGTDGSPISPNSPLPISGTAIARITYPVTFTLSMAAAARPVPPVQVNVEQLVLDQFTAGAPYIVPASLGLQGVTLSWTAQNASGFILTGTDGTNLQLPYTASGRDLTLPMTGFPARPAPVTYTLTALGYPYPVTAPPVTVNPIAVTLNSFTATSYRVARGQSATLDWSATAATGFMVAGQNFPPNLTSWVTPPLYGSVSFELTAYGYRPDGTLPTKSLTILVPKEPIKEGSEKRLPKENPREQPFVTAAAPEADPPSGSQQAFIGSDERPDVGAGLPSADPGFPASPQG